MQALDMPPPSRLSPPTTTTTTAGVIENAPMRVSCQHRRFPTERRTGELKSRRYRRTRHRHPARDAVAPDDAGCSFHFSDGFCDDSLHFLFDGRVITLKALSCYIVGTSRGRSQIVMRGRHGVARDRMGVGNDGDDVVVRGHAGGAGLCRRRRRQRRQRRQQLHSLQREKHEAEK